jgi:hypothetical protein
LSLPQGSRTANGLAPKQLILLVVREFSSLTQEGLELALPSVLHGRQQQLAILVSDDVRVCVIGRECLKQRRVP